MHAGYWLSAQCTELIITPSGDTGSVRVFMVHGDVSQMNEKIGYRPTYIGTPRYKAEGNSDSPLSDDTRKYLQSQVERVYEQFVADIVRDRGRALTADSVRKTFGEGRTVDAAQRKTVDRLVAFQVKHSHTRPPSGNDIRRKPRKRTRITSRTGSRWQNGCSEPSPRSEFPRVQRIAPGASGALITVRVHWNC